jgi:phage baseplate assembly protein W
MAVINRKARFYRDIDLAFAVNPFTKDVYVKTNEEAVKTAIKNLVLTQNYERPFHPEIGSPVYGLLFEPFTPLIKNTLEKVISQVITNYEPRATLLGVTVDDNPDQNSLDVQIDFRVNNIERPITVNVNLQRTR